MVNFRAKVVSVCRFLTVQKLLKIKFDKMEDSMATGEANCSGIPIFLVKKKNKPMFTITPLEPTKQNLINSAELTKTDSDEIKKKLHLITKGKLGLSVSPAREGDWNFDQPRSIS